MLKTVLSVKERESVNAVENLLRDLPGTKITALNDYRLSAADAVRSVFHTVGHALWTTTAVLSLGFLVFASSGFEVSWALGLMVAITISFALLADFLLLPTLLMALDRKD